MTSAGLPARKAALEILSSVLRQRRALDFAISEALEGRGLDPRDAGFARAIATETLRRFGVLESLIGKFVPKPPQPHKAGPTMEILLAGACELLFLKVAPHAAVDAANRLAQADKKAVHFKSLINAVLRRVSREGSALIETFDVARLATPDWLWTRWSNAYGDETAHGIALAHLAMPPLDLTFKPNEGAPIDGIDGERLASHSVRLRDAGRVEDIPGYRQGAWWVQDFAATLPANLLGEVAGKPVIDLCAAPGGKTAQLAARGAQILAVDLSEDRLGIVRENLERLRLSAETVTADAREWRPQTPAPFVLLDAPCTATGTIRRHPDLPWIKSAADITAQESLQRELLDAASEMTANDGVLVYAVCSLEPEEGVEQIEAFLSRRSDFARLPLQKADVPDASFISPQGDLRTLPHYWADKGGMDGFYAARLVRKA